jgi:cell shape-determining protein MreD
MALPVLGLALMIQIGIISRVYLLSGSADVFLVILVTWSLQSKVRTAWFWALVAGMLVGYVSGLPWYLVLVGYLIIIGLSYLLQQRIWQSLLLEVFIMILLGTMINHVLSIGYLVIIGTDINFVEVLSLITLPSILLNLILAIPIYFLIRDLANWIHPSEGIE